MLGLLASPALAEPPAIDPGPLWDWASPDGSADAVAEQARRASLAGAETESLLWRTQQARAHGLAGRFDEGHALLDPMLRELDDRSPELHARYLLERGRLWRSGGRPDAARPAFEAAWEIARDAGLDGLAVDAGHMVALVVPPEQAIDWGRRLLAFAERSPEPDAHRWRATLLNNLGWTLYEGGCYAEALDAFERAVPLRTAAGNPGALRVARYSVGKALRALGRHTEAVTLQTELHREAAAAGSPDPYIAEELGELMLALAGPEAARPWFVEAWEGLRDDAWLAENEAPRLARIAELAAVSPRPAE
jgi:tetratricopeptide (TPR) repeat protein